MAEGALLPVEFADLEPFVEKWALPTATERYACRLSSTMTEMQGFYEAIFPRAEAVMTYLEQFELDDVPDGALRLYWMLCSLSTVSFSVDIFKQVKIPDSGSSYFDWVEEPVP